MQDLDALKGKSLAELREIAKVLGIGNVMLKKRELMEKIAEATAGTEASAANDTNVPTPETAANAAGDAAPAAEVRKPRGRRPRLAKSEGTVQGPPLRSGRTARAADGAARSRCRSGSVRRPSLRLPKRPLPQRRGRRRSRRPDRSLNAADASPRRSSLPRSGFRPQRSPCTGNPRLRPPSSRSTTR